MTPAHEQIPLTEEELRLSVTTGGTPDHGMSFGTFIATEGGRKCPQCGKYAKASELGWIGLHAPGVIVDAYGHLPGFGCNRGEAAGD